MSIRSSLLSENRALYLPAISETFARFAHRGAFARTLPFAASDLNFLDPASAAFFYPFALYSAGQAAPTGDKEPPPCMVSERDRSETLVLGDSGGFQIQTGSIKFDRSNTPLKMLRWLEGIADWSMVLDFPTGGINSGQMTSHAADLTAEGVDLAELSRTNGLPIDYNACLAQTKINNDRFLRERMPSTRLLNVLQGRNERESKHWFDSVKHYPFEGWAFAGANRDHFSLVVRRLLDMRRDGLLEQCGWIHMLGTSSLDIGCLLTAVQRSVRRATGLEIQLSFDSATPFLLAANQGVFVGHSLDQQGWSTHSQMVSQISSQHNGKLLGEVLRDCLEAMPEGRLRYPAETYVSKNVTLGDLRDSGGERLTADGYYLLMHHNIEGLLQAHRDAHNCLFPDDHRQMDPLAVPLQVKIVAETIRMLFEGEVVEGKSIGDPYDRIDEWTPWMDDLAG